MSIIRDGNFWIGKQDFWFFARIRLGNSLAGGHRNGLSGARFTSTGNYAKGKGIVTAIGELSVWCAGFSGNGNTNAVAIQGRDRNGLNAIRWILLTKITAATEA